MASSFASTTSNAWIDKRYLSPCSSSSPSKDLASTTSITFLIQKKTTSTITFNSSSIKPTISSSLQTLHFPKHYQPKQSTTSTSTSNTKTKTKTKTSTPIIKQPTHPTPPSHDDKKHSTPQNWNLLQKAASKALEALENAIVSHELQNPLPKTSDPRVQLAGNFAPVPEHPVEHSLPVTGKIPKCIQGVYVRNGANPLHSPLAGHHLFDGDGMIHAVKLENSSAASYACRFTETHRLVQEKALGRSIFPKAIGELHGHYGIARLLLFYARNLLGLVDNSHGMGVANAGLVYFNNRLLAMSEDDLPYHVRVAPSGDVSTVGRYDFDGQLKGAMIAHPKVDPVSGDLHNLSYDVVNKPYLKYFRFGKDGNKYGEVEIPVAEPTMLHDFAITERFVVIPDQQVVFKLSEMFRGSSPVVYDKNKVSRFGVLDKNAHDASNIRWIEAPECFCFHVWNAWEEHESNEIVVIGSCMTPADSIFNECDGDESFKSVLSEIRLNMKTRKSTRKPIVSDNNNDNDHVNLEAGMVNKNKLGRKTQYAYLAIAEPWPKVSGFAKVDIFSGEVKKYMYGDKRFGGEPMFVPNNNNNSEREDDGYILAFVHDEKEWKSELKIVNAMNLKLEATIKLPSRVPYGFHGTFIHSKDLQNQASNWNEAN